MPFSRRRRLLGAVCILTLIAVAALLPIALEWRQALNDIDSMIETPAAIVLPTDTPGSAAITTNDSNAAPDSPVAQPAPAGAAAPQAEAAPTLSEESLNILLLGTDARAGETEPTRTDALVLVRIAGDSGRVSMLSIPRDLWVNFPGGGEGRINGAFARGEKEYGPGGGPALVKATVGKLLGLKVDNFMLINFQGFETLIDRLGGITVDVPEAIYDPAYPTEDYQTIEVRFRAGPQTMNGERALIYARTRHADSDFGRNQRQQLVLMSIFNRIRERGLLQQLTSLDDYTGALRGYVRTDVNYGRMLELGNFARTVTPDDVLRYAIDNTNIVELRDPATFAVEPKALRRIVGQFTGEAVNTAGGQEP